MRSHPSTFSASVRTGLPAAVFIWLVIVAAAPSGAGGFVDEPTSSPSDPAAPAAPSTDAVPIDAPDETDLPDEADLPDGTDETSETDGTGETQETDVTLPWILATSFFAAGAALGAIGSRLATATRGATTVDEDRTTPGHPQPRSSHDGSDAAAGVADRLVEGLIASYDLATDDGQRSRILETLRLADVISVEPAPLTVFDPSLHHVLRVVQSSDPGHIGLVARTERPGWRRNGEILRAPEVSVYPLESAAPR